MFAVLDDAQGEGLGRAVWQVMREETPRLFWRSRHHNAVNVFYHAEADGCIRQERWRAFWYGLDGFEQSERVVAHRAEQSGERRVGKESVSTGRSRCAAVYRKKIQTI